MKYYTDYPFKELGDIPFTEAPIREIEIITYDGDKYCCIKVENVITNLKLGYIYLEPRRSHPNKEGLSHQKAKELFCVKR